MKSQQAKLFKSKSKWIHPYDDHPSDRLKIRLMLDEKIKGSRIIGLEARIEPGDTHQMHIHENEYVLVYSLKGRCKVTIGEKTRMITPHTMIFIPPKVQHKFENRYNSRWEGIAFAIGNRSKIKNIWLDEK